MALPISGPITQAIDTADVFLNRKRYKQKRPYNLNLSYSSKQARVRMKSGNFSFSASGTFSGPSYSKEIAQAQALAFERLKGAMSDRASMGENLGQLGSSARLIVDKVRVVSESLRRLRRFDVSAFAAWMDKGFVKRNSKFASQLTLEINFAITPSINDIFSAINILQEPIKSASVKGRATVPYREQFSTTSQFSRTWSMGGKVSAEYGARVAISNPNLYLANTMGLINPVQIAWQLLPGSFLIDWFLPVEQFLGYATDFLGLRVESSYSTWFARGVYSEFWTTYGWTAMTDWADMQRAPTIVLPSLALRPLKVPSLKRAANAVSLLIQAFVRK